MDKRKKYIAVFDTETIGIEEPLVYDLGLSIVDKKGCLCHQENWIVDEVFSQEQKMRLAYFNEKIPQYHQMISEGKAQLTPWARIQIEFNDLLSKWNVRTIAAYNLAFDRAAMMHTQSVLVGNGSFLTRVVEPWDLWGMAAQTILRQKSFQLLAREKGWLTPAGNLLTNAEVAYRYITGNHEFIEEHTALADSTIEAAIMAQCLRQHQRMEKGILKDPWKLAQIG